MKQFREFKSQQQVVNEIGPIGATIAGVMGLVGGAIALKKGLDKFKGYRENRADKKARKQDGFDMKVKVLNPETGKEEEQEFYIDPKKGNKDLEKLTGGKFPEKTLSGKIKAPTDDDLDKMEKQANRNAKRKNSEVKRKIATGNIKDMERLKRDDLTTDQQSQLAAKQAAKEKPPESTPDASSDGGSSGSSSSGNDKKSAKAELLSKGQKSPKDGGITDDKEANDYKKIMKKAPQGWETKKFASGATQLQMKKTKKESKVLKFGEFIKEDVMKDMRKISKSKKDMEIKLDDGTEIPIDPMTAEIFVKYIEGLKSSEQKKVINQIQRTERGFMKVLGKAHGE